MRSPTLLWVAMAEDGHTDAPDNDFLPQCSWVSVNQRHARDVLDSGTQIDAVCFSFRHADMDGLRLVADIKTRFPALPHLLILDFLGVETVLWAMRIGIFDVMVRPVTRQEAARCMKRLFSALELRPRQSGRHRMATAEQVPIETRFHQTHKMSAKVVAAAQFISRNYRQAISELEMAKRCDMSVFQFSRAFRTAHGVTFRQFLSDQRIACAKRLLCNLEMSVTDVAALSGFNDPSYFARAFRSETGVSPTAFREATAVPTGIVGSANGFQMNSRRIRKS
jgi:AraC-like DNA-binding protein